LFPLFLFIAISFFTSKLAGRSEIIAILASGVSYRRIMLPYFIGGLLLAGLLLVSNAFIIPQAEVKRLAFQVAYFDNDSPSDALYGNRQINRYFRVDSFTYAGVINYDTVTKCGGPFFMHNIKHNQMMK